MPHEENFAGWGVHQTITDLGDGPVSVTDLGGAHDALGELSATSICGNDITSSCLYVSALCALQAGIYAPLALALVAIVLYFFRKVYAEVGSALPLNGGAYNVLLNTTSKQTASLAACLTLLSYIATAVISAYEAMHYAHHLWEGLPIMPATVALLGLFAFLNIVGISESAVVATAIFVFHLATLSALVVAAAMTSFGDLSTLKANWSQPDPRGFGLAIFYGFAAAMLGISGFESSANFIEEQKPGVFPKTLRNMWMAVSFFNPVISLLSLCLLPLAAMPQVQDTLLAEMGARSAWPFLSQVVSVDAVLVLSGAVLTSFVGVTGLVRRMSLDRCLPQVLLKENRWRKTNHWIILLFFALCCSILVATHGDVQALAGVYTISFLGVMSLFALGNMMLKVKRARLPREERASWGAVMFGFLAVIAGLLGNIWMSPQYVQVFAVYFIFAAGVVAVMFLRLRLLSGILFAAKAVVKWFPQTSEWLLDAIRGKIQQINNFPVIYFTRGDHIANLNRAALYVLNNEQTHRLMVVHVHQELTEIPAQLAGHLRTIDELYPELRVDFVSVRGRFGPELIERLSRKLGVPKNYMFIGTPGDRFPHNIAELGGVRLII
jgi:amino acid transporter